MTAVRMQVVDGSKNTSYLVVRDGLVYYMTDQLVPLCLSCLAGRQAAALRFRLEDATSPAEMIEAARGVVGSHTRVEMWTG